MKKCLLIVGVILFSAVCFLIGFYLMAQYAEKKIGVVVTITYCMSAGILMWEAVLYIEKLIKNKS